MSAPEITKAQAMAAIEGVRIWGNKGTGVIELGSGEEIDTLLTLARAGASVLFPGEEDVERVAKEMAVHHGGKVLYRKDGHAVTVRERFGYGVDSGWGHHLDEYANKHWRDYIDAARSAIAAMKP